MEAIKSSGAILEVSVTSNWLTNAVPSIASHPARLLWEFGIPICINTDDPGIMAIDLNHEFDIWTSLGFSNEELEAMTIYSLDRSFLPEDEKQRLFRRYFMESQRHFSASTAGTAAGGAWASLREAAKDAEAVQQRAGSLAK